MGRVRLKRCDDACLIKSQKQSGLIDDSITMIAVREERGLGEHVATAGDVERHLTAVDRMSYQTDLAYFYEEQASGWIAGGKNGLTFFKAYPLPVTGQQHGRQVL